MFSEFIKIVPFTGFIDLDFLEFYLLEVLFPISEGLLPKVLEYSSLKEKPTPPLLGLLVELLS